MFESTILYSGVVIACLGMLATIRQRWFGLTSRSPGLIVAAGGVLLVVMAFVMPAKESRIAREQSHLDHFAPRWQFREFHTLRIAAPPERVFDAMKAVRADEIRLFNTLTWIRRGGRRLPESILSASGRRPLLDVATSSGFVWLADDRPREVVVGAVVLAPPGARGELTPDVFLRSLPPGFVLASMNFVITPDGRGGSVLSTETRVYANSDAARRRFAAYWRVIYPGSSLIRRMWLRAIATRATR